MAKVGGGRHILKSLLEILSEAYSSHHSYFRPIFQISLFKAVNIVQSPHHALSHEKQHITANKFITTKINKLT